MTRNIRSSFLLILVHLQLTNLCRRNGFIAAGWRGGGGVVVSEKGGAIGVFGNSSSFASSVLDEGRYTYE